MANIYRVNDKEVKHKVNTVIEIIRQYIEKNENIDYIELKRIFSDDLGSSSTGVLKNESDLNDWEKDGRKSTRKQRFKTKDNEILKLKDNTKIYISSQWGDSNGEGNFKKFCKYAEEDLGFSIDIIEEDKKENNELTIDRNSSLYKKMIKNIILYGSPGVGKTHNTNKLIRLIEDGKSDREIFETIKVNENSDTIDISDIKERVKFVTFHQSFGYEDFIEGFRPNEEGNIGLEKGIFLEICSDADENLLKSSEERKVPFKEAFNRLFKEKIENEESVKIDLKRTGSYFKVNDFNDKTIYFEKQSGTTKHTLSITSLEKMYDIEKNDFINGGLAVYYEPILEKLLKIKRESHVEKIERKNYYLVIDEINRGNISKIFGELITLIEEDKRDTLEVTLPYSKKPFKIPSNLYIIGTMNSTDKSIALIDIALRRRFTFLKMKPNETLVSYSKAKEIFNNLNERITQDLGEDYVIGHSYFMQIQNDDDLDFVLEYKIIPLIEEYYYGDDRLTDMIVLCKRDTTWGNDAQ